MSSLFGLLHQSQGVPSEPGGVLLPIVCLIFLVIAVYTLSGMFTVVLMAHVVFVGTFKLDISFRLSRFGVTGLGSVVFGRANIEVVSRPLGAALVRFSSNFNGSVAG